MTQMMILSEEVYSRLQKLVKYADDHPLIKEELLEIIANGGRIADEVGMGEGSYKAFIPVGFCIVLTIEEQDIGWVRHLQVSYDNDTLPPNPEAVVLIMPKVGFKKPLKECCINMSELKDGRTCIHIFEEI